MPTPRQLFDPADLVRDFAQENPAVYTYKGDASGFGVTGIYREKRSVEDIMSGVEVVMMGHFFKCVADDIPNADEKDQIVIDGDEFTVIGVERKSSGLAILTLEKNR